jgi:hypothetical protein
MSANYTIHPERVADLVAKLEKLARKAQKLGCDALTWTIGATYTVLDELTHEPRAFVDVEIDGTTPQYDGWTFVASIEQYGERLLVTTAPGETVPEGFDRDDLAQAQTCEHCRTARRRKQTYLLRHEDGRVVRVGSTCIKDFLGHNLPAVYLFTALRDLDEFVGGLGGGGAWAASLVEFLTVAALCIRLNGWLSRTAAQDDGRTSTADQVLGWYDAKDKGKRVEAPSEHDQETAQAALQWALAVNPDSDYLENVRVVSEADFVTYKTAGIAASIISASGRAKAKAVKASRAADLAASSQHFGAVGARGVWQVTLLDCVVTEGYYGTTFIYKFVTADGNACTWFSSRDADIEVGESYWLTGTVKKHDSYRGTAETHVTRCKLSTEPPKPPRPRKSKPKAKPAQNPNVETGEDVTIEPEGNECWVWGTSTYPDSSVLAGQCRRRRIECFESMEAARAAYPRATACEGAVSAWANREAMYSFDRCQQPGWFDPARDCFS